uniref:Uncharacterized protein n=1 Tax=Anopheles minimus TaxID=112268 RepID=A0A182W807_9DIPT
MWHRSVRSNESLCYYASQRSKMVPKTRHRTPFRDFSCKRVEMNRETMPKRKLNKFIRNVSIALDNHKCVVIVSQNYTDEKNLCNDEN